jgi:hypothetical protein
MGEVEADETFTEDRARNMHLSECMRRIIGTAPKDKNVDMGFLSAEERVRSAVGQIVVTKQFQL